tara:strand:+ start:4447 stop:4902 length:456 start_codon:yes stop_codon:yes gene_type:complete
MADVHDKETRSKNMAAIKAGNTKPEMIVRRALHNAGFRYRLHEKTLPGKPDLVLRKYNAVIFVNGCFWHRHECPQFKWPKTKVGFWTPKLNKNASNDKKAEHDLKVLGWRVGVVWECALKGPRRLTHDEMTRTIVRWLKSENQSLSLSGST